MAARHPFDYAVIRVVPRVEREEFLNAGVLLFCDACDYLAARVSLHEDRLRALSGRAARVDFDVIRSHLAAIPRICEGDGPIGQLPLRERWHWLTAPRNTVLQVSPPHTGLTDSPEETLARLLDDLVLDVE